MTPQFSLQPILVQTSDEIDEVSFGKCQFPFVFDFEVVQRTTASLIDDGEKVD